MTDKPQSPDHFRDFESDRPAEPERAITPFAPFDSRPKLSVARSVDPLADVPRLFPRDPKSPSEFERLRQERAARDTEPSDLLDDEDKTPAARPFEVRVERDLKELKAAVRDMKKHCQAAAEHSLAAAELVRGLRLEMQKQQEENDRRLRRLELDRFWIPRIVSTAALVVSLLTAGYVLAMQHR